MIIDIPLGCRYDHSSKFLRHNWQWFEGSEQNFMDFNSVRIKFSFLKDSRFFFFFSLSFLYSYTRLFKSKDWFWKTSISYFLTSTSFQALYGKVSDIFGRKPVLLFAYSGFGIGCLCCGLARNIDELIAARVNYSRWRLRCGISLTRFYRLLRGSVEGEWLRSSRFWWVTLFHWGKEELGRGLLI